MTQTGPACAMVALAALSCVGSMDAPSPGSGRPGDPPAAVDEDPATTDPVAGGAPFAPVVGIRRLSAYEYDNTLRDLLGDTTRSSAQLLPFDGRRPFDNDSGVQLPSQALVEGLELGARGAVGRLLADLPRRNKVVGCAPAGVTDKACFREFVSRFGRRALRRPLAPEEVTRFEALLPLATDAGDFYAAAGGAVLALLQHPELVYRIEVGVPVAGEPGLFRLTSREMATRLSYYFTESTPDDWLLDLADGDKLQAAADVREAAVRLLGDPRAKEVVARFHMLWLNYETPIASGSLARAMMGESDALIQRVVFDERLPWQRIFRFEETFITQPLAKHYGVVWPGGASPGWVKVSDARRRGLLGHGAFLSNGAKFDDTSPTLRGKAVRERLLCQTVPPPPPEVKVDMPPPPTMASKCKEPRYRAHASPGCASCHALMDNIGFGLENYDAQGRYRRTEPVETSCVIGGVGEVTGYGTFKGPGELGDLVTKTPDLVPCLFTQAIRFAVGRTELDAADQRLVTHLVSRLTPQGAELNFSDLLLTLVSDAFRYRREPR